MPAGSIDDGNGQHLKYLAPLSPTMELGQAVSAHDPNEPRSWPAREHERQCPCGKRAPELGFEGGNRDARISGDSAAKSEPLVERQQVAVGLERIAGCDNPPDAIKMQALQRDLADEPVRSMRRIEGPAEQPDALARLGMRRPRSDRAEPERSRLAHTTNFPGTTGLLAVWSVKASRAEFGPRKRRALPITLTDESAMAAAATIGDRTMPIIG